MSRLPVRLLVGLVRLYRAVVSPMRPVGPVCRFEPSCSTYAIEALESWGLLRGSLLAVRRLGRCHPWGGMGDDPVPVARPSGTSDGSSDRSPSGARLRRTSAV